MDEATTIQEDEIIADQDQTPAVTPSTSQDTNQATILLNLDSLIKNNISSIDRLSEEIKKYREMFSDSFSTDPVYHEHEEKAKEANKIKLATRQQILKQPQIGQLAEKIRSINADIKERKMALSDYLLEYQRMAGVNEIETDAGDVREIVNEAKLIKKNSKR